MEEEGEESHLPRGASRRKTAKITSSGFVRCLVFELMIVIRACRTVGCTDPNDEIRYKRSYMFRYLCGLEVGTCRGHHPMREGIGREWLR